jgi:hypothetical protein
VFSSWSSRSASRRLSETVAVRLLRALHADQASRQSTAIIPRSPMAKPLGVAYKEPTTLHARFLDVTHRAGIPPEEREATPV